MGVIKGDTRSLDNGSYKALQLVSPGLVADNSSFYCGYKNSKEIQVFWKTGLFTDGWEGILKGIQCLCNPYIRYSLIPYYPQ